LFIPESPRWLSTRHATKAFAILEKIGGKEYAQREMDAIRAAQAEATQTAGLAILFSQKYKFVLVLGVIIAVFQQWCGTNVIFNYAQEIFQSAGYEVGDVLFNIVVTGIANVLFTILAIFTVDKWGRRSLMLLGAGGLCLIYAILGICYYFRATGFGMVILVVAAIACYALTLGPCTWVLIAELFPNRVRAVAVATCTFMLWVGSSTLTYTFPFLNQCLGSYGTFWIYSGVCLCGFLFFLVRLPETKDKSLEELEKELVK
jgi:SP family sugar porter-like MFS transporter